MAISGGFRMGERVEHRPNRQHAEAGEKQRLAPDAAASLPIRPALSAMTSCVMMMQADMNGAADWGLPLESNSPSCGNMAAFAKWNRKAASGRGKGHAGRS